MLAVVDLGWEKILLIVLAAVVLFGARKLPEIGRGLGKGIREFKAGLSGASESVKAGMEPDEKSSAAKATDAEAKDSSKEATKDRADG